LFLFFESLTSALRALVFFEEAKMRYITESLKISAQGVPKTQLKEYQIQYNSKNGEQKQEN